MTYREEKELIQKFEDDVKEINEQIKKVNRARKENTKLQKMKKAVKMIKNIYDDQAKYSCDLLTDGDLNTFRRMKDVQDEIEGFVWISNSYNNKLKEAQIA